MGTFVPRMGTLHQRLTSSDALFSKTQQAVLGLLFTHVDESFHLREIVRRSGIGQGTVQRELKKLTAAGILTRDVRGRQIFFQFKLDYPIYQELHGLAIKTFGVAQKLAEALNDIADRIKIAFIYTFLIFVMY